MNEIGELLVETRQNQQLEIEQVCRETNIAKEYIIALESDNYEIFPAEPYIIGFLRNYSEYLGLNSEEILDRYKQIKIQETSLPTNALLPKKEFKISKSLLLAFAGIIALTLLSILIYFIVTTWIPLLQKHNTETTSVEKVVEVRKKVSYKIEQDKFNKRLFENDQFSFSIEDKTYNFVIEKISPDLNLKTDMGNQIIALGQSLKLDLNNDLIEDIDITVEDIDKNNPNNGVLISVLTGKAIETTKTTFSKDITVSDTTSEKKLGEYQILFESGSAYPVTLNATFRGYCLFRHEIDKSTREERYYQKAEQLTAQANNGFRIWASNGNVVKLQLVAGGKTADLQVSRPGEIIVKDLKWIKDDVSRRFKFIAIDVD